MGIFDIFRRKKNEISIIEDKSLKKDEKNIKLYFNKRGQRIPEEVFNLLWFIDGEYENYYEEEIKIDFMTFKYSFMGSSEPSAISVELPIKKSFNIDDVRNPDYYPSYNEMTPQQRWIYLDWLKNVDDYIHISYVFIFYYGLERHLFLGNYEEAFNMILRLRNKHKNKSFLKYSSSTLIASSLFHRRKDLFSSYLDSLEGEFDISNLYIFAKQSMGMGLTVKELISIANKVGFTNKRYIKNESDIFENELEKIIIQKYNCDYFDLSKYSPLECEKGDNTIMANYSIDKDQKTISIPLMFTNTIFLEDTLDILKLTHENVKIKLKELRKSKEYTPQVQIKSVNNEPTEEPDKIFKKSLLFDEIDVHLFDKNINLYNDALCPYCNQVLLKRPSRKTKCKKCNNTFFVKKSVFTGQKLLLTEIESQKLEEIRSEYSRRKWIENIIHEEDINTYKLSRIINSKNIKIEQAIIEFIEKKSEKNKKNSRYDLYRENLLTIVSIYEILNYDDKALDIYLNICIYDMSGHSNGISLEVSINREEYIMFDNRKGFLARGIVRGVSYLSEQLNLDRIDIKRRFYNISNDLKLSNPILNIDTNKFWNQLEFSLENDCDYMTIE